MLDEITQKYIRCLFLIFVRTVSIILQFCKPLLLINCLLSAALAKSGPLDLPSEKSSLLFFAHEKGLGHMFQK